MNNAQNSGFAIVPVVIVVALVISGAITVHIYLSHKTTTPTTPLAKNVISSPLSTPSPSPLAQDKKDVPSVNPVRTQKPTAIERVISSNKPILTSTLVPIVTPLTGDNDDPYINPLSYRHYYVTPTPDPLLNFYSYASTPTPKPSLNLYSHTATPTPSAISQPYIYRVPSPTPTPVINIVGGGNTSYTKYGNTTYGSDGSSYSQYGNTLYGNDGSSYSLYGNTVYGSDGSTCSKYGNTSYCNNGNSYSKYGNTVYGNDGSSYSQYGNTTYGRSGY
jgi:hypothetical protein